MMNKQPGLDPDDEPGLNGDGDAGSEVERALTELFHRPRPDPAFVQDLEQRLLSPGIDRRRAFPRWSKILERMSASMPSLAWGAAAAALILILAWTIRTSLPVSYPAAPLSATSTFSTPVPTAARQSTAQTPSSALPPSAAATSSSPSGDAGRGASSGEGQNLSSPQLSGLGKLAFVQDGALWVKPLGGQAQRLAQGGSQPRWSPGGGWLAFRKGDEQVWVIGADGSSAQALNWGEKVGAFAWSSKRDEIAYVAGGDELRLANAKGKDLRVLARQSGSASIHRLAWSPDGKWIAYQVIQSRTGKANPTIGIWKVSTDGGRPVELLTGSPTLAGWTGSGRAILYWDGGETFSASLLADGIPLMLLPASGGAAQQLGKSALVYDDFVRLDPSGSGRVAVVLGGNREAWTEKMVYVFDGTNSSLVSSAEFAASSPAWSPDGRQIAYAAAPDAGKLGGGEEARQALMKRRIWVKDFQTGKTRQLTDDPRYRDEYPLWSADGSSLLFARLDEAGRASLWLVPSAGGPPSLVLDQLAAPPSASGEGWFGYYGHLDWAELFDWSGD